MSVSPETFTQLLKLPFAVNDDSNHRLPISPPSGYPYLTPAKIDSIATKLVYGGDLAGVRTYLGRPPQPSDKRKELMHRAHQLLWLSCRCRNLSIFKFIINHAKSVINYDDIYQFVLATDFVDGFKALNTDSPFYTSSSRQTALLMNLEFSPQIAWHLYNQHGPQLFQEPTSEYSSNLLMRGWLALLSFGSPQAQAEGPALVSQLRHSIDRPAFEAAICATWDYLVEWDLPENLVNLLHLGCPPTELFYEGEHQGAVFLSAIMKSSSRCLAWFAQLPELVTQARQAWLSANYDKFFFRTNHTLRALQDLQRYQFDLLATNDQGNNWFHSYCAFDPPDAPMLNWLVVNVPQVFDLPNAKGLTPLQCLSNPDTARALQTVVNQQLLQHHLPPSSTGKPNKTFL